MMVYFCIKWARMALSHQDMSLDFSFSNILVGGTGGVVQF